MFGGGSYISSLDPVLNTNSTTMRSFMNTENGRTKSSSSLLIGDWLSSRRKWVLVLTNKEKLI